MITWDAKKDRTNIAKHGISLAAAEPLFDGTQIEVVDDRFVYGEGRIIAIGWLRGRLHVCVFTWREDAAGAPIRRIISLRKANRREIDDYQNDFAG